MKAFLSQDPVALYTCGRSRHRVLSTVRKCVCYMGVGAPQEWGWAYTTESGSETMVYLCCNRDLSGSKNFNGQNPGM